MERLHVGAQGPAHDLPVKEVKDYGQVHPVPDSTQIRDVGNPFLSAPFRVKLPVQQVLADRQSVVRVGPLGTRFRRRRAFKPCSRIKRAAFFPLTRFP